MKVDGISDVSQPAVNTMNERARTVLGGIWQFSFRCADIKRKKTSKTVRPGVA